MESIGSVSQLSRRVDSWSLIIYGILIFVGWLSIYAACYDFEDTVSIFDLSGRAGKQLLWMALAMVTGLVILLIDGHIWHTYAYPIYLFMMVLLLVTIFIAPDIKGSHSWLVIGPISLQPAEFAKFATALALGRSMGSYGFTFSQRRWYLPVFGMLALPFFLILAQNETGSALVFSSFLILFYREGMTGWILALLLFTIFLFIDYIRFSVTVDQVDFSFIPIGATIVTLLSQLFTLCIHRVNSWILHTFMILLVVIAGFFTISYFLEWRLPYITLLLVILSLILLFFLILWLVQKRILFIYGALLSLLSIGVYLSIDKVFNDLLGAHQRARIMVSLGLDEDLSGAGYNVNQSIIAIGSGGLAGKGYLSGTQTKLKYVPEQDTDFIYCTVGEEFGFIGSVGILLLFATLLYRLTVMAERARTTFARVYCYSVFGILLFHLCINIGMVLGLLPVIGIPLPYFSYGGSSLLSFTILLFIALRLDMYRSSY